MDATEYDVIVFGGGATGKLMAWTTTREGRRTAIVERKYIVGSCPNVACLPSKNVILTHLMEGIVLALDLKGGRMFITDFGGSVYSANLDGSNRDCRRKHHRHCIRGGAVRILSDNAGTVTCAAWQQPELR